jgi:hypothetical protein
MQAMRGTQPQYTKKERLMLRAHAFSLYAATDQVLSCCGMPPHALLPLVLRAPAAVPQAEDGDVDRLLGTVDRELLDRNLR